MSTELEKQSNGSDAVKWIVSILLLAGAVVGNAMLGDEIHSLVRAGGVVIAVAIALFLAAKTAKGQEAMEFASTSRTEVRKVVWPTRQETIQTTIIVLIATMIMSLVLWGIDGIMLRIVSFLTGLEL